MTRFRLAMEPRGERIGGEDFDRAIYDYFDAGVRKMWKQPVCADGLDLLLLRQCRKFKESLARVRNHPRCAGACPVKVR